jgi:hypothetical protein
MKYQKGDLVVWNDPLPDQMITENIMIITGFVMTNTYVYYNYRYVGDGGKDSYSQVQYEELTKPLDEP